jgi:hypothetical protein
MVRNGSDSEGVVVRERRLTGTTKLRTKDPIAIDWKEYPRIEPGTYSAYCAWGKIYYDRQYRRWTCLLRFKVLRDSGFEIVAQIPMWLALGNGEKPHASRRGRYMIEWVKAHGGPPPRNDRLSPTVFVHRVARVEVGDTTKGPVPYSVVKEILGWETGRDGGNPVNQ